MVRKLPLTLNVFRLALIACWLGAVAPASAQEAEDLPGALLQAAEEWMEENLDDDLVEAVRQVTDRESIQNFLSELQQRFESPSVASLLSLKAAAPGVITALDQFEETQPYADWLRTHLDYFEVAEQLQREPSPKPPTIPPAGPLPNPSPERQRSAWASNLKQRPLPAFAREHVPKLKPVFVEEQVPAELVWLAEVESSFNARAKSPAGAAGLFQLTKPTAKSLGLSTWLPDERLHPVKNARAASRYLRMLHRRYGDWRLALAAYNAGPGRVDALLSRANTRSYDAIALRLPSETQMYVPKCEATVKLREGRTFAQLKPPARP